MAIIDVYGKGWSFPPQFSVFNGIKVVTENENIRHNLLTLFSTSIGERIMRESYGCDFISLVFNNITDSFSAEITSLISNSIQIYEPRVEIISVDVSQDNEQQSIISISLSYRILGSDIYNSIRGILNTLESQYIKWK